MAEGRVGGGLEGGVGRSGEGERSQGGLGYYNSKVNIFIARALTELFVRSDNGE